MTSLYPISIILKMKNQLLTIALMLSFFLSSAQEADFHQISSKSFIQNQVDSLKEMFAKEGYVVLKEAAINMESEYEMPVIVPLQQKNIYQFVFIGEPTSRLYEVRMFDWNEKQVYYKKKLWGDVDGNIISYGYVPQFTEFHMIKPVQINKQKKKNLSGYVMLLKKTSNPSNEQATAYHSK